ncbi:MAG: lysine exporter LysO family protein [Firmicutes bacterium]|nr:lysine exporter LysO family protein [Bacillota bacterium]
MSDVIMYLSFCVVGYVLGIPLRKVKNKLGWVGTAQSASVIALVFIMGIRIGSNEQIVSNLASYGIYSAIYTLVILFMSALAVSIVRRFLKMNRYGLVVKTAEVSASEGAQKEKQVGGKIDKMTLLIVGGVVAGILAGYFVCGMIFTNEAAFEAGLSLAITIGLCVLLIFVGLDLGIEGQVINNFKNAGLRILALPVAVALGTMAGAVVCSVLLPVSMGESLAIGCGFGWYSLGAGILMDAGYMTAGAISFMHNVMREVFSIILVPIVARYVGYVEAIALPGAPGMDVCLPIVERSTSGTVAVYSFISGLALSLSVAFLVPLFL